MTAVTSYISQNCYNSLQRRRGISNEIVLTDKDKRDIVLHHNDLRRLTGSSNMRFMVFTRLKLTTISSLNRIFLYTSQSWDTELEWIAQEYSKKCNFQHNSERKHSRGWRLLVIALCLTHSVPQPGYWTFMSIYWSVVTRITRTRVLLRMQCIQMSIFCSTETKPMSVLWL